jgi:hypothetical protein
VLDLIKRQKLALLALVFCFSLVGQLVFWSSSGFVDEHLWVQRVEQLAFDMAHGFSTLSQSNYSAHPGMAAVSVAALFYVAGLSSKASLVLSVAIFIAVATAGATLISYLLRPGTWWWLPVMFVLSGHYLYAGSTPTNAMIAPYVTLIFLMSLWLVEAKGPVGFCFAVLFGSVIGASLAVRMPITAVVSFFMMVLLFKKLYLRQWSVLAIVAIVVLLLLDPLMLVVPVEHISLMTDRVHFHAFEVETVSMSVASLLTKLSLMLISITLLLVLWGLHRQITFPVPRRFAVLLLTATAFLAVVFLAANSKSIRYFFPLMMAWEVFLYLWLLHLVREKAMKMRKRGGGSQCLLIAIGAAVSVILCSLSN